MINKNLKLNRFFWIVTLFVFSLFIFSSFNINAEDTKDELQQKEEELKKEAEKIQKLIELKQKEGGVISSQLQNIVKENERVEKDIQTNKQRMEGIQSDVQRIERTVKQKEDHIKIQQQILAKIIRDYYQDYSKTNDFFEMVQGGGKSLFSGNDRLDQVMSGVNDLIKSIEKEQDDLITEKEKLQGKVEEVKNVKYELEKRNDYLDSTKAQKEVLMVKALNEKKNYEAKLSKIEQEQLSIQNEIDKLDYDSTGSYSLSDLPPKSKAGFSRPVFNPYLITQGYGKTNFSYNYKGGLHNGIDFVAKGDKSILAAGAGKVITGNMGYYGYGRWVAIDHENGLVTLYGHMSSVVVKNGDEVERGDKIGVMGTTGFSTGPHLHFSIFVKKTFAVVKSSSMSGLLIPTGASLNPNNYL